MKPKTRIRSTNEGSKTEDLLHYIAHLVAAQKLVAVHDSAFSRSRLARAQKACGRAWKAAASLFNDHATPEQLTSFQAKMDGLK